MKNKITAFISLFYFISVNAQNSKKKQGTLDFDLLMSTRQRDSLQSHAHDTEYISDLYRSGPYLIYDCERSNYACVHKDGFAFCKSLRKTGQEQRQKILPCAPLKKFSRYDDCIFMQKHLVDFPVKKYFCLSDKSLKKIIFNSRLNLDEESINNKKDTDARILEQEKNH